MRVKEGDFAQAVYEFPRESPSDLGLKVKDVVKVTEVIDENWAKGQRVHPAAEGIFPLAFVERVYFPSIRTGQKIFLARQDFVAEQIGDLELALGDIIVGTEAVDDSWWNGKNGPLKGMFPLSFVVELEHNDGVRSRSFSCRSNSLKTRANSLASFVGSGSNGAGGKLDNPVIAQALVNVTPQLDGELAFQMGDLIEITAFVDNDWMYGRCRDQEGLVSSVCVEFLEDVESPSSEKPSDLGQTDDRVSDQGTALGDVSFMSTSPDQGDIPIDNEQDNGYRPHSSTGGSYTSENTRSHDAVITPYARVLYSFIAQYPSELSLKENQIVSLIQHLNSDWTEGEVDGKKGMFPTSFIEIVVDCPHDYSCDAPNTIGQSEPQRDSATETKTGWKGESVTSPSVVNSSLDERNNNLKNTSKTGSVLEKQNAVEEDDNLDIKSHPKITAGISDVLVISACHEIGLVLHSFQAEVEGDVSVIEGDTVEVVERIDANWIQVQLDCGKRGLVPANHVEIIGLWPKEENEISSEAHEKVSCENSESKRTINHPESVIESKKEMVDISSSQATTCVSPMSQGLAGQGHPTKEAPVKISTQGSVPKLSSAQAKSVTPTPRVKPVIAPKPTIAPKPPVMKPSSKPAAFYTAKLFSSSKSTAQHVILPNESQQKITLPSLDNLIEGEISKAKSRTSSQNSTSSGDSVVSSSTTLNTISTSTSSETSTASHTTQPPRHSNNTEFSNPADISSFDPITSPSKQTTKNSKNNRPKLNNSVSLPAEPDTPQPSSSTSRRASSSIFNNKPLRDIPKPNTQLARPSKPPDVTPSNSAFVNPAFEQEVDEGVLIPNLSLSPRVSPPSRPPPRAVCPPRPSQPSPTASSLPSNSTQIAPSTTLTSKFKAPPPRPTGPRLAPAPSRVPLVPIKAAADAGTKPVPLRQAPTPPSHVNNSDGDKTSQPASSSNNESTQSHHGNSSTRPQHSLRRPPPRPSAFPSPPRRPPPLLQDLMKFSPERATAEEEMEEELDDEKRAIIEDLKKRIAETVEDIKKYEQSKAEIQHSLKDTSADNEEGQGQQEDVEEKLEFVENTLEGLRTDRNSLIENLFKLSAREGRQEKAQLLASQNAEEAKRRREEDAQKEAELKARRRSQRSKVIEEIVETEKDYLFSLQLCQDTFLDGQIVPPAGVDLEFLLGNMEEITDVSQKLLANLEAGVSGKAFEDQRIGNCFAFYFEDMKNTYAPYCRNHDSVITTMEKYKEVEEISQYLDTIVEKMKEQMNVFDLAGVLIKPVQRILKYPLLLNELLKNTEENHQDKVDILLAIKAMTDVAKAINEYKRRKDLVYKYKKDTDQTFGDKLAKLSLHSLKKKSSRMRGRLSTNLGMGLQLRDEAFEREDIKFQNMEKAVKIFLSSTNKYLEQSQETMRCQECLLDDIEAFYQGNGCLEATRFKEVNNKLLDLYVNMRKTMEDVVVVPLNKLVTLFEAPSKVIQKRFDKLLDYNHQLGKGGDGNDKEQQMAKNDYEAMNAQLLDELPKFYNLALNILNRCMSAFVRARRDFMDQSLKESCALLELPSMLSKDSMMATFNIRHTTAFDHMCMLSFIPRGFNPRVDTVKSDRSRQRTKNGGLANDSSPQTLLQTSPGSQSDGQKAYLHQQYPPEKLFTVTNTHNALDVMDISLTEGMLVGVFKELDPMGNKDRWFVDDGVTKGFVPREILRPLSSLSSHVEEDVLSIHSYDSAGGGDTVPLSHIGNSRMSSNSLDSLGSMQNQQQQQQENQQASSPSPLPSSTQQQTPQQYYYALYDFQARHANEASLVAGNYVTVLAFHDADGNTEWWLVNSESGHGYAPANYLAPMPFNN